MSTMVNVTTTNMTVMVVVPPQTGVGDGDGARLGSRPGPTQTPPEEATIAGVPVSQLWIPYVIFSLVLLTLMFSSFARFHYMHGHKYRRRRAELWRQFNENQEQLQNAAASEAQPPNGGVIVHHNYMYEHQLTADMLITTRQPLMSAPDASYLYDEPLQQHHPSPQELNRFHDHMPPCGILQPSPSQLKTQKVINNPHPAQDSPYQSELDPPLSYPDGQESQQNPHNPYRTTHQSHQNQHKGNDHSPHTGNMQQSQYNEHSSTQGAHLPSHEVHRTSHDFQRTLQEQQKSQHIMQKTDKDVHKPSQESRSLKHGVPQPNHGLQNASKDVNSPLNEKHNLPLHGNKPVKDTQKSSYELSQPKNVHCVSRDKPLGHAYKPQKDAKKSVDDVYNTSREAHRPSQEVYSPAYSDSFREPHRHSYDVHQPTHGQRQSTDVHRSPSKDLQQPAPKGQSQYSLQKIPPEFQPSQRREKRQAPRQSSGYHKSNDPYDFQYDQYDSRSSPYQMGEIPSYNAQHYYPDPEPQAYDPNQRSWSNSYHSRQREPIPPEYPLLQQHHYAASQQSLPRQLPHGATDNHPYPDPSARPSSSQVGNPMGSRPNPRNSGGAIGKTTAQNKMDKSTKSLGRKKRPLVFTSNLNGSMVDIRCGSDSSKTFPNKPMTLPLLRPPGGSGSPSLAAAWNSLQSKRPTMLFSGSYPGNMAKPDYEDDEVFLLQQTKL